MDSPQEATDVFSLSDQLLAERLTFVKEIGFGNWGSVWLCKPKSSSERNSDVQVAVKLVHRSKTSTTAARVRSLWNEMKIVRSFKQDPHPSIIPFHSFIITPSYALITMAYLPTLVPVEVSEPRAKVWFRSLLSGVQFLHQRGVVHNDIKPANILLSPESVPVLVDFGFAEKYDVRSPKAFHSNLTYGTPEYLSPERARGLPHDTRKSDIWSLGVTFFEILVGRTPFEYEEGEQFASKADLEKYWARTMRGKWVGDYHIPKPAERLLKRMIVPNADLRCTAAEAMVDLYWEATTAVVDKIHVHKKAASVAASSRAASPSFAQKDREVSMSRLLDISLPWSNSRSTSRSSISRTKEADVDVSERSKRAAEDKARRTSEEKIRHASQEKENSSRAPSRSSMTHARAKSAVITTAATSMSSMLRTPRNAPRKRAELSPVRGSPAVVARDVEADTENDNNVVKEAGQEKNSPGVFSLNSLTSIRRPLGPRQPSARTLAQRMADEANKEKENEVIASSPSPIAITRLKQNAKNDKDVTKAKSQNVKAAVKENAHTRAHRQTALNHINGKKDEKKPRGRAGVLADLTGFAKNVDLSAHVAAPSRVRKESRVPAVKREMVDKENCGRPPQRKDNNSAQILIPPHDSNLAQDQVNALPQRKDQSMSEERRGKDSVRDRMREWERLRELERLEREREEADKTSEDQSSEEDETDADVQSGSLLEEGRGDSILEEEQTIEVARVAVRASAQILSSRNASMLDVSKNGSGFFLDGLSRNLDALSKSGSAMTQSRNESAGVPSRSISVAPSCDATASGLPSEESTRVVESGLTGLKHSIKLSIDKGVRMYKSSTLAQLTGRSTPAWSTSPEAAEDQERHANGEGRFSWEDIGPDGESPVAGADDTMDRMNMWIRDVEKVVEDCRQNFASSSITTPPPLPIAPLSRTPSQLHNTSRSSRLPRRLLAANQIFAADPDMTAPLSPGGSFFADNSASYVTANETSVSHPRSAPIVPSSQTAQIRANIPDINIIGQTPTRKRRATITTQSPQTDNRKPVDNEDDELELTASPSKRREKSKSQGNLIRHIRPVSKLELELSLEPVAAPSPRLSAVLDRSLFIAPPVSPRFSEDSVTRTPEPLTRGRSVQFDDDLTCSPYHVEPYPTRRVNSEEIIMDSPDRRRLEGVYDRFLMATTGVKRLGRGYQSDNLKPIHNTPTLDHKSANSSRNFKVFNTTRRAMPPPVSSDDQWRSSSVDEFGYVACSAGLPRSSREESKNTAALVRRAIKAMVPGKTVSRRLSRTLAA